METEFVVWLQRVGAPLHGVWRAASDLGPSAFLALLMVLGYWCWDYAAMARIWLALLCADWLSGVMKIAFHSPRPFWVEPEIQGLAKARGFGMPSGHAFAAVAAWLSLGRILGSRSGWAVSCGCIAMVSLSRIYLGVHTIGQVAVGLVSGYLLLWIIALCEPSVLGWYRGRTLTVRWWILFGVSLFALGSLLLTRTACQFELPEAWHTMAVVKRPQDGPLDPFHLRSRIFAIGWTFGFLAGYETVVSLGAVLRNATRSQHRWERALLGVPLLASFCYLVKLCCDASFAWLPTVADEAAVYTAGILLALTFSLGCPWLFARLRI